MTIHELIAARRAALKLSQPELAKRINDFEKDKGIASGEKPIQRQTIQHWERGGNAPKRTRLPAVAAALEMPLTDLVAAYGNEPVPAGPISADAEFFADFALVPESTKQLVKAIVSPLAKQIREANQAAAGVPTKLQFPTRLPELSRGAAGYVLEADAQRAEAKKSRVLPDTTAKPRPSRKKIRGQARPAE